MKPGNIVVVHFPFTDLENTKKRPALVLKVIPYSSKLNLVQIAMITSNLDGKELNGDYLIQDWKSAGLLHPSQLRLAKVATIEGELIQLTLGKLSKGDHQRVSEALQEHFQEWK